MEDVVHWKWVRALDRIPLPIIFFVFVCAEKNRMQLNISGGKFKTNDKCDWRNSSTCRRQKKKKKSQRKVINARQSLPSSQETQRKRQLRNSQCKRNQANTKRRKDERTKTKQKNEENTQKNDDEKCSRSTLMYFTSFLDLMYDMLVFEFFFLLVFYLILSLFSIWFFLLSLYSRHSTHSAPTFRYKSSVFSSFENHRWDLTDVWHIAHSVEASPQNANKSRTIRNESQKQQQKKTNENWNGVGVVHKKSKTIKNNRHKGKRNYDDEWDEENENYKKAIDVTIHKHIFVTYTHLMGLLCSIARADLSARWSAYDNIFLQRRRKVI